MTPEEQAREIPDVPPSTRREVLQQQAITKLQAALAERDREIGRLRQVWTECQARAARWGKEADTLCIQRDALVETLENAVEHCAQIVERSDYLPGCKPICNHGFPTDCLAAAIRALKNHYAALAAGTEEK